MDFIPILPKQFFTDLLATQTIINQLLQLPNSILFRVLFKRRFVYRPIIHYVSIIPLNAL